MPVKQNKSKDKRFLSFIVSESPNLIQTITLPTILGILYRNRLFLDLLATGIGLLVGYYLAMKSHEYLGSTGDLKWTLKIIVTMALIMGIMDLAVRSVPSFGG